MAPPAGHSSDGRNVGTLGAGYKRRRGEGVKGRVIERYSLTDDSSSTSVNRSRGSGAVTRMSRHPLSLRLSGPRRG
jgi:hypothetical protein